MALIDLIMPKLGESITEATILKWLKQPGDTIKLDETLLEIATDKVDSEVPSTAEGIIHEILFSVNDVVPVGKVIARIKTTADDTIKTFSSVTAQKNLHVPSQQNKESIVEIAATKSPASNERFYSPLVLNIAASEAISMSELENIPGTGNEGRVTKKDILQYVNNREQGTTQEITIIKEVATPVISSSQITTYSGNVEIIETSASVKLVTWGLVCLLRTM